MSYKHMEERKLKIFIKSHIQNYFKNGKYMTNAFLKSILKSAKYLKAQWQIWDILQEVSSLGV